MCLVPLFVRNCRVSCGKCPECLRALRSDWIYRADQHCRVRKFKYFVTLTFDDDHLPDDESGCFAAFTDFRKKYHKMRGKFDYLVTLERGEKNNRLHLHLLLYTDRSVSNDFLRSLWRNGFIKKNSVTHKRIRYVCSYMFKNDLYNKVRLYRASNGFGGTPVLPYRIRVAPNGAPFAVPLPRYYCKKYPFAKKFASDYYAKLYRETDFEKIFFDCESRFSQLRSRYGSPRQNLSYFEFLENFIQARVRLYPTFSDPRDLIGSPCPAYLPALSSTYKQLLQRVLPLIRQHGGRCSGNLERYLTVDCPMSLAGLARKARHDQYMPPKPPPVYLYRGDFEKKQLTLYP